MFWLIIKMATIHHFTIIDATLQIRLMIKNYFNHILLTDIC